MVHYFLDIQYISEFKIKEKYSITYDGIESGEGLVIGLCPQGTSRDVQKWIWSLDGNIDAISTQII